MSIDLSASVSRSGRVRKKSAKLKEMEEIEKTEVNGHTKHSNSKYNKSSDSSLFDLSSFTNDRTSDHEMPRKSKKLKIKFSSSDNGGVEEVPIDNVIEQSDLDESNYLISSKIEPTVPSLKIKLFQNSCDNYVTSPKKKTVTSKKVYKESENAANLLFQQITSGQVSDSKRKSKKKLYSDYEENVLFEPNDTSEDEEASLVISDSSESLQAALEHAKSVKIPLKRLTETKLETTKSGLVKLKKVDCKADKKQKLSKITAYTLFARENRSRIQQSYPSLDFANISKRLGEIWRALPQREKMQWKRKAQKQKGLNTVSINNQTNYNSKKQSKQINKSTTLVAAPKFTSVRHNPGYSINYRNRNQAAVEIKVNLHSKTHLLNEKEITNYLFETGKPISSNPVDIASCFKILGDSLNAISAKLNSSVEKSFDENDALDLLLDSAICAMSPLICLTSLTPELNVCNENTKKALLDNVVFLMPGI